MSDYEKPVKKCQDAPLGFRTVNGVASSQDAQRELLLLEHEELPDGPPLSIFSGDFGGGSSGLQTLNEPMSGQHNTPKVACGTVGLDVDPTQFAPDWGPIITTRFKSGVVGNFIRIATGSYFFPLSGLSDFYYAEALPISADDTTVRRAEVTPASSYATALGVTVVNGVSVSLWEETALEAGALGFALADFSFDLVVYGNRNTDLSESLVPFVSSPAWVRRRSDVWRAPRSVVVKPP